MKRMIIALVAMFMLTFTTASAMSYEQARQQALFLTDKMAYELNLTDDQYEAAYEVNLDYLMGVNTTDDLFGTYWRQRNVDLQYILLDWQYQAFMNATYFYRPLYWDGGFFHFGIYARYPRRDYFFFGRPTFFATYRGGHCWRMNGGRSWYNGRQFGGPRPGGQPRMGMRDGFNRGDFGRGHSFGNLQRQSSTRTTVTRDGRFGNPNGGNNNRSFGNPNGNSNNRSFGNPNGNNNNRSFGNPNGNNNNRSFGNPNGNNNNRSFGNPNGSSNRSFGNGTRDLSTGNRSSIFGGNRPTTNNRSFGTGSTTNNRPSNGGFAPRSSSPSSSSFGAGRSFGGGNNGGGHSFGGGGNNGGGHFGGRR